MKLRTIIYLFGNIVIGLVIYYFFPYTPIPGGVTIEKIVFLKSRRKLLAYSHGRLIKATPYPWGRTRSAPKNMTETIGLPKDLIQ